MSCNVVLEHSQTRKGSVFECHGNRISYFSSLFFSFLLFSYLLSTFHLFSSPCFLAGEVSQHRNGIQYAVTVCVV